MSWVIGRQEEKVAGAPGKEWAVEKWGLSLQGGTTRQLEVQVAIPVVR